MTIEIRRKDIEEAKRIAVKWGWSDDLDVLAAIAKTYSHAKFYRMDKARVEEFTAEEILQCKQEHIQIT